MARDKAGVELMAQGVGVHWVVQKVMSGEGLVGMVMLLLLT